ncbi:uncharacterized protein LOC143286083 [Babylonia areolata]|uniref:uncharacterized protein LOC143286083 n=1 Tax=Babylonia areolata TaxID=304850 RepID=UPI003FD1417B
MTTPVSVSPQTSSVMEVIPSQPLMDQSANIITEVLPPGGFTLVNLDLEPLQLEQSSQQPSTGGNEEADELDDGVNLVVKGSWWWCKDCNIKQKFGAGESIEDHLRRKHSISNKTEETVGQEFVKNSHVDLCRQTEVKDGPSSDVISSVFTVPSDSVSVQDQGVETFIVIDGTTTVQVITKQTDDNTVLLTPVNDGNKPVLAPQDSSKAFSFPGPSKSGVPTNSSEGVNSLSENEMKPIPVLPALPLTDPQQSSLLTTSATPNARTLKEKSGSSTTNIPEISSPDVSSSSQPHSADGRANLAGTRCVGDFDIHGNENGIVTKTCVAEYDKPVSKPRKPAQSSSGSNSESCDKVTRKKTSQTNEKKAEGLRLMDCSVRLTRLSLKKMNNLSKKPTKSGSKSKPEMLPVKVRKQITDSKKSVPSKPNIPFRKSAKQSISEAQSEQHLNNTKNNIFSIKSMSSADNEKKHTLSGIKSRTSSGRKIKKPARYFTGSENEEEEDEDQHDKQTLPCHLAVSSRTSSSNPEQDGLQSPSRLPKKRRISSAGESEMDSVPKTRVKKVREEKYSCEDCGRRFRFANRLEKHRKLYAGQTMQRCSVCDTPLHNQDLLNVHLFHVHLTKESTSCLTCGKVLGSKRNLLNHLLTHHSLQGQTVTNLIRDSCAVHECSICDEAIIIGEGRVERHYLLHEKPVMCMCQKCGRSFRHKKELYSHLKTHEDTADILQQNTDQGDTKTECTEGSQQDNQATEPQGHDVGLLADEGVIAESVKQIMKFEESTSERLENKVTLTISASDSGEAQMRGQHSSHAVKPLIYCALCKQQFSTKKLLYQHLKVHGSETSDLADDNDNGLLIASERESVAHPVDLSAGVPFGIPCSLVKLEHQEQGEDLVRKSFTTTVEGLVVPDQIHYSCALCGREFESESKARRHVSRFNNQRTILQCSLCPSRFHNLDVFNVHYAYIHQPAGAALCMTCKTEFNNKGDFLTHLGNSPLSHPLSHRMGFATFVQDACGTVTCSICQKSMWNYPMNIANHTRKHRSLSCPICRQEMPYKYALFIHLQVHANSRKLNLGVKLSEIERQQNEQIEKLHRTVLEVESSAFVEDSERKFCCSFCESEVLCTRKNVHQHLDLHARKVLHSIREGQYFCPDCGEDVTASDQNISGHLSSHGQSQVLFVCIFCSQTFGAFDVFKEHESKKHWLNVYFEKNMCEVCGKEFVSRQQFQKHIKLHEEKQGLFSCSHCKQTFRFESKLQKHMAKHKRGSYACQFCGKLYMTKISLDRHEQVVHIGIKDFKHKCKLCDAQFINATHLRDHVTNKHTSGTSYRCGQCGMGFRYLSTFARHKRVVHDGDTPYVCQECGEKFPQKKQLQRHSAVHTGINPFQCPACPKTFSLDRTMREHFDFAHGGIQRFVCPHCGSKFPRSRSLKRHLVTCRLSGVPPSGGELVGPAAFTKVPVEMQAVAKQQNTEGLVVIQQV